MVTLTFPSSHKTQLTDITVEMQEEVIKSGVKDGTCTIFVPHTTASVFLFENQDPNLRRDLLSALKKRVEMDGEYSHTGDNAAAHLKSAMMGGTITLFVEDAKLVLGKWQGVFFGEFDGPRQERKVMMKVSAH